MVNGIYSSWHDVISGIPQGSILAPLLFIIYINDLPEYCSDLYTKLYIYTDDTKLFRYISNSADQYCLQSGINKVGDWAKEWLLKLNIEKCCGMSFAANTNNVNTTKYYIEEGKILHEIVKLDSFERPRSHI